MTTHSPLRCAFSGMAAPDADGYVVLMDTGNYPSYSSFLNETWVWTGADWHNTSATLVDANGPLPGRSQQVFVYDGYNIMLYGGKGGSSTAGVFEDTWTWHSTSGGWVKRSPANPPFGRFGAQAGFLPGVGTVMFGGFGGAGNGQYLLDTWIWDGSGLTWTQSVQANGASPPARIGHVAAAGAGIFVVFGGQGTNSQFNDTWSFNGTSWTKASPTTSPSVRSNASMVYDPHGGLFVMFGGENEYNYLPETWVYNGTTWIKVSGPGPSGLIGAQMAYDAQTSRTLLFGGISATTNYPSNQTWEFDALLLTWTQLG